MTGIMTGIAAELTDSHAESPESAAAAQRIPSETVRVLLRKTALYGTV
eukprot:COSAG02_NODE_62139_length_266_cov_1.479042_1_plen_48_part_01